MPLVDSHASRQRGVHGAGWNRPVTTPCAANLHAVVSNDSNEPIISTCIDYGLGKGSASKQKVRHSENFDFPLVCPRCSSSDLYLICSVHVPSNSLTGVSRHRDLLLNLIARGQQLQAMPKLCLTSPPPSFVSSLRVSPPPLLARSLISKLC